MTTYNTHPDGQSGDDIQVISSFKPEGGGSYPVEVWRKRGEWDKINALGLYKKVYPPSPEPTIEEKRASMICSPWQFRKALNQLDLRTQVETAVAAADQTVKDAWEYATTFERKNELVEQFGIMLGKTEEDLDAIFELAMTL